MQPELSVEWRLAELEEGQLNLWLQLGLMLMVGWLLWHWLSKDLAIAMKCAHGIHSHDGEPFFVPPEKPLPPAPLNGK